MDVAYSRVLFLGTAGVGMTSFKRSLMKLPWEPDASIGVSDNSQLRQFTHEWHTLKEDHLRRASHEDEIKELVGLILAVYEKELDATSTPSSWNSRSSLPGVMNTVDNIIAEVISCIETITQPEEPQPFLHFWDCCGQPLFLEILPVFLTSRTLFFLIFDAEKDLKFNQEEVNMTTLDYMLNWMANIHGHLMSYDEQGDFCSFPRMYCIGTHGDRVKERKSEIKRELKRHYRRNFRALVEGTVIVDNTTSGKGKDEDSSLQALRDAVIKFTKEKLVLKTPLSWILFRKVIQVLSKKYNVISLKDACIIGAASKIPPEDVPHALMFYHELGVLLFYPQIDGMKDKVVLNPKYIVDALGEMFPLGEIFGQGRYCNEWELFHECGILVQPLYVALWRKYNDISPEILIKVLVHFRIAVEVKTDKYPHSKSKQYFMPLVLKSAKVIRSSMTLPSNSIQAAPLHITFNSGYVPPGFFTRFVVVLTNTRKMELCFEKDVYRNRITFRYQDPDSTTIEHVIVTDCRDVIQINVQHHHHLDQEVVSFTKICQAIRVLLEDAAKEVEEILKECASGWTDENKPTRYIFTHKFKYVCTSCSTTTSPHYIKLPPTNLIQKSQVFCDKNTNDYRALTELEKVWFKDTSQSDKRRKEGVLTSSDKSDYHSDVKLLDITDLDDVIEELQSIDYTEWKDLGLILGLYHNTLGTIEEKCRGNPRKCLTECMAAWLKGEDKVMERRGPSWSSLVTALLIIGENFLALNICVKHGMILSTHY
ncbi:PREDICTED: uncharacterized protein LOC109584675 isoform X1 [Amphimedon queenslandica]|uniref:COR domain-containing protein n=1 Tax=Amphimedon queenslandica TaxID=400682 RepID=A0AAN0JGG1_AMPQE|nr:PREDICTED: uncharacterized protein LOC109584675 isoform X1 [Amphimedon queenslandica]XP_019856049.1 PREDICTED: uncharacterized protein LOC109584675 isoform X1 [Amphimedon queenslandica]|eukprot:XP_019856048.1 PREDICTED: uncharacterized protein LOC109584675 isoform X1 [Amphimedon queenslandica]